MISSERMLTKKRRVRVVLGLRESWRADQREMLSRMARMLMMSIRRWVDGPYRLDRKIGVPFYTWNRGE